MYAKIVNEKVLSFPPYEKDGIINYNSDSNAEVLVAEGYKIVEREEIPEGLEDPEMLYREEEHRIVGYWVEREPPVNEEELNDI